LQCYGTRSDSNLIRSGFEIYVKVGNMSNYPSFLASAKCCKTEGIDLKGEKKNHENLKQALVYFITTSYSEGTVLLKLEEN
jgi:hypothetical protein